MPKELLIIRHAKSDWENPGITDFNRPLNERGHRNAPEMAKRLVKNDLIPQQIISSPALRAFTTAKYFADAFKIEENEILKEQHIYEAFTNDLIRIICGFDDSKDRIALFGHNPAITDLAVKLSGKSLYNVATCGIVLVRFPFEQWNLVSANAGELVFYDYPKNSSS